MIIATYRSIIQDMSQFGIGKIKEAELYVDGSFDGVQYHISFDGGKSFAEVTSNVASLKSFGVFGGGNKVQVKITFNEIKKSEEYTIRDFGSFLNVQNGTTLYFKNKTNGREITTKALMYGQYSVALSRGIYDVYTKENGVVVKLMSDYNPEAKYILMRSGLDKQSLISSYLKDSKWEFCIFDTFTDLDKIHPSSNTHIDVYGDLSDGQTQRSVRYWALLFKT